VETATLGTEPEPDPARRTELGEAFEYRPDGAGDGLIRMKQDFPIQFSPNEAYGQTAPQFPTSRLVADATVETSTDDMQLRFTHGALQTQQQSIVEQRRMVHTIVVADERVGDATEFQQTIPIRIVSGQARTSSPSTMPT